MKPRPTYGLIAEFSESEPLLEAVRKAHEEGYRRMDAYTPYHVDGLAEALGMHRTWVPSITLIGGLVGGITGYGLQAYSAIADYPLNVGGRPLHSWPAFVPVTFELTVLSAALFAAVGMFALNGLPQPYHPVFNTPFFAERSHRHFYLCIEAEDRKFDRDSTREFLRQQGPIHVWEVPA